MLRLKCLGCGLTTPYRGSRGDFCPRCLARQRKAVQLIVFSEEASLRRAHSRLQIDTLLDGGRHTISLRGELEISSAERWIVPWPTHAPREPRRSCWTWRASSSWTPWASTPSSADESVARGITARSRSRRPRGRSTACLKLRTWTSGSRRAAFTHRSASASARSALRTGTGSSSAESWTPGPRTSSKRRSRSFAKQELWRSRWICGG